MRDNPDPQLAGRLNAHRRILVALAAALVDLPALRPAIVRMLRESETVIDHEEDPGIDPGDAFAVQRIADEEIRRILQAGLARHDARLTQEETTQEETRR
ncbi:hypothetical protein LXM94_20470 [Rhizobium sp. TRM95111]|uniref:hypothetical protein n=1 Tax=Rhizobium alarense TaxID=2846851 RepID=UPI001F18FF83|nr:hypothetical protein [Rhizobium alarense]MCF3642350.1 hypothetical protein [Rhizobium alarense]